MNPHLDELISLVNHPAIQGRRGEWKVGDFFWTNEDVFYDGPNIYSVQYNVEPPDDAIWLPPLSDPIQPERGLLGFLKGLLSIDYKGGNLGYYVWVIADDLMRHFDGPTPEIAVCKAVIAQSKEEK